MRVMDDPRYHALSVEDQNTLVHMTLEEQWQEGFGPYPATAEEIGVAGKNAIPKAARSMPTERKAGTLPVQGQKPRFVPEEIQDNFVVGECDRSFRFSDAIRQLRKRSRLVATVYGQEALPPHLKVIRQWPPKTLTLLPVMAAEVSVDMLDQAQQAELMA